MGNKPHIKNHKTDSDDKIDPRVSLSPLKTRDALAGLLAVKPPQEARSQKPKKKKDSKPKRES